jgi:predicted AAA+ superfamily ATPase
MLVREKYLQKIRPYYDSEQIKLISGVRRCGKSVLLSQIAEELENRANSHVVYINLEDYSYRDFWDNPKEFHSYLKSKIQGKTYFLLDEIQHVSEFESVLASLKATTNASLFATGSNSTLLSGKLASRLTGRVKEFLVRPFSFAESNAFADISLKDYLLLGGFPLRFQEKEANEALRIVKGIYESILTKDIYPDMAQSLKTAFECFATFVLQESGNLISMQKVSQYLSNFHQKTSVPTLYTYLRKLQESYIIGMMDRFDITGKKEMQYIRKVYAMDPAFITINKAGNNEEGFGFSLETVIGNELQDRGYAVYVGKMYNGEIDFIAKKNQETSYVQVATYMETKETKDREFSQLLKIKDNYPKYVISMDNENFSHDGITHINANDFLLGKTSHLL